MAGSWRQSPLAKRRAVIAALVFLAPVSAKAQQNCGPRDQVTKKLTEAYGERLTAGGLQKLRGQQSVMELWTSDETGSYTILITRPNGLSCIVAVGTDFFQVATPEQPAGSPL